MARYKNNIHKLWKKSGLTLPQVAEAANISVSHLNNLKAGVKRLNQDNAQALAAVFGCSMSEVMGEAASEKTADHIDSQEPSPLSHPIGEDDARLHYVDAALLAEAIESVKQAAEEQGLRLTAEQMAVAVANTYSESEKFAEKPSRAMASMAIRLLNKGRDNGRDVEAKPR